MTLQPSHVGPSPKQKRHAEPNIRRKEENTSKLCLSIAVSVYVQMPHQGQSFSVPPLLLSDQVKTPSLFVFNHSPIFLSRKHTLSLFVCECSHSFRLKARHSGRAQSTRHHLGNAISSLCCQPVPKECSQPVSVGEGTVCLLDNLPPWPPLCRNLECPCCNLSDHTS